MADVLPTADEAFGPATEEAAPTPSPPSPDIQQHVSALIAHESGGNPNAVGDSGLALGLGQMHPEVRQAYGVTPNSTPDEQKAAVTSYFTDLWKKHGGNADDALSEYHLGATNYGRDRTSAANLAYLAEHQKRLGTSAPLPTADEAFGAADATGATTSTTTTPDSGTAPAPPPSLQALRDRTVDQTGAALNDAAGLDKTHWLGRYTAALGKPSADALYDVYSLISDADKHTEASFGARMVNALKVMHPLAIPAEIVQNVATQALKDGNAPAWVQTVVPVVLGLYAGAKTPLPGAAASEEVTMPLQGTAVTRQAAQETAAAAGLTQTEAQAAAKAAVPGIEAATAAKAALTPAVATSAEGGPAAITGLERRLATVKDPVQGIYEAPQIASAVVDASAAPKIIDQITALEHDLGPTLTGKPAEILTALKEKAAAGQPLTVGDLTDYKRQLDVVLPFNGAHAANATPRTALLYGFKQEVKDLIRNTLQGDEKEWYAVADAMWKGQVKPTEALLRLVKKDPETAVERLIGNGTSDKQAAMAQRLMDGLKDTPENSETVQQAFRARLIQKATDTSTGTLDPVALAKAVGNLHPGVADAMLNPGAQTFFKVLTAAKAATAAAAPNRLAYLTAKGIQIAGADLALHALPGVGGLHSFAIAGALLPSEKLAAFLANSKTANLLARALKTPTNSAIVPTLLHQLQQASKGGGSFTRATP